jgi:branched-chain amino acid transport system ATP-binding protein
MLKVNQLDVFYGNIHILWDLSLHIEEKETVAVVGSNGAGKSTLLKAIIGLVPYKGGSIEFFTKSINRMLTHERIRLGLVYVPEGRKIFPNMTVMENLEVAGSIYSNNKKKLKENIQRVHEIFPILEARRNQKGGTLSGGEAQMLAIARGVVSDPKLMMLDEPSLGLAPLIVNTIFENIKLLNTKGITIVLVEQNIKYSLGISSRAYVLENGKIIIHDSSSNLLQNEHISKVFLGM